MLVMSVCPKCIPEIKLDFSELYASVALLLGISPQERGKYERQ